MTLSSSPARTWNFPIARFWLRFARNRAVAWKERHQLPFNFYIHLVGIPLAFTGLVLLYSHDWGWGVGLLLAGYLLQYLGHRAEGNDMGELLPFKRLLGLPAVPISPRWLPAAPPLTTPVARPA